MKRGFWILVMGVTLSGLTIAACTLKPVEEVVEIDPKNQEMAVESSGEVDQDLETINQDLESLDAASDFATFSEDDITQ